MSVRFAKLALVLGLLAWFPPGAGADSGETAPENTVFVFPCESYREGLRGKGNFGVRVKGKGTVFSGTWHLAEDVWLPAGTEVRAVADGVVRYSDFSPTWTDEAGRTHWNLGNVIVVEHALVPPEGESKAVCSFYVHLAADRRVKKGERVERGQVIGRIGKDRSEENGRYPAHLHFGLHRGPYYQLPPSFVREFREAARGDGIRLGDDVVKGELDFHYRPPADVLIEARETGKVFSFSLLVGSTAPKDPPEDIMCWCEGYGDEETVKEWLRPSTFLAGRAKKD